MDAAVFVIWWPGRLTTGRRLVALFHVFIMKCVKGASAQILWGHE